MSTWTDPHTGRPIPRPSAADRLPRRRSQIRKIRTPAETHADLNRRAELAALRQLARRHHDRPRRRRSPGFDRPRPSPRRRASRRPRRAVHRDGCGQTAPRCAAGSAAAGCQSSAGSPGRGAHRASSTSKTARSASSSPTARAPPWSASVRPGVVEPQPCGTVVSARVSWSRQPGRGSPAMTRASSPGCCGEQR